MKKQVFKGLKIIEFWVGVNIIGIPEIHQHKLVKYTNEKMY